jgi:MoxR-like ATPase
MLSQEALHDWRGLALRVEEEVRRAIVGQDDTLRLINVALFARGHVLLEGDVGVGKTTVLRAFARAVGGDFERVEGTVDLMPNDLVYHTYVDSDGKPRIEPGPLLRHGERLTTFFFNEINRARPQVQSLLLRAMAERTLSAFNREYSFPHMTVFADRNRVEREETFELASAARDRFMFELRMLTPADDETRRALVFDPRFHDTDALIDTVTPGVVDWMQMNTIGAAIQQGVSASDALQRYAMDIWAATSDPVKYGLQIDGVDMSRLILAGASPRGMGMLHARCARRGLDGRSRLPDAGRRPCRAAVDAGASRVLHAGVRNAPQRTGRCTGVADAGTGRHALTPGKGTARIMSNTKDFHYRMPGRVGGQRPGAHRSTTAGSGQEFIAHLNLFDRPDPRRLDLRASLRDPEQRWLVRVTRQRAGVPVYLLADVSTSMRFGSGASKLERVAEFARSLGDSTFRTGDSLGLLAFDSRERTDLMLAPMRSRGAG